VKSIDSYTKMLFWLIIGVVVSLFSHYLIDIIYYNYNFDHVHNLILSKRTELFLLGAIVLFIFYILFSSLLNSSILGGGILLISSGIIGTVSRYKSILRAEPLYPNELYMIRELPSLVEMVGLKKIAFLFLIIVFILTSFFFVNKFFIKLRVHSTTSSKKKYSLRIFGIMGAVALIFYIGRFNYPNNKVKKVYSHYATWVTYNQSKNYSDNGFVAGFLYNLKAPPMNIPDNYSKDTIEEIYEKYYEISQQTNKSRSNSDLDTNILFVMNESFSDPFNLVGIDSDKDPLINYREIIKNTLRGNILAPNFGGG